MIPLIASSPLRPGAECKTNGRCFLWQRPCNSLGSFYSTLQVSHCSCLHKMTCWTEATGCVNERKYIRIHFHWSLIDVLALITAIVKITVLQKKPLSFAVRISGHPENTELSISGRNFFRLGMVIFTWQKRWKIDSYWRYEAYGDRNIIY